MNHINYKTSKISRSNRFKNARNYDIPDILNKVHLYIERPIIENFETASEVKIPVSEIAYSTIYEQDEATTFLFWSGVTILGTIGTIVLIDIIANGYAKWLSSMFGP